MSDTEKPDQENEAVAVTDRPNDIPIDEPRDAPLGGNSTFAERARARQKATSKQVEQVETEDKAITSAQTKRKRG